MMKNSVFTVLILLVSVFGFSQRVYDKIGEFGVCQKGWAKVEYKGRYGFLV